MTLSARLDDPLAFPVLQTALQPIVALEGERAVAFEALTRVHGGGMTVTELFDGAAGRGRAVELNLIAVHAALGATPRIPDDALLFVNADPAVLASSELPWLIRDGAARTSFPLSRLVVEVTERSAFTDVNAATRVLDELRESGIRFALDDFGSAHSHLTLIDVICPSFIKISHDFGMAFEQSTTRTRIVRHLTALAHDFECSTILEGVESAATADAARALGIEFAQGYHFGRPIPSVRPVGRAPCDRGRETSRTGRRAVRHAGDDRGPPATSLSTSVFFPALSGLDPRQPKSRREK